MKKMMEINILYEQISMIISLFFVSLHVVTKNAIVLIRCSTIY